MVFGARLRPKVVARVELLVVHQQLALKHVQLLEAGMHVRRILGSWNETDEHAHPACLDVGREELAEDAGRRFLPFGFRRRGWRYRWRPTRLRADSTCQALPQ